MESATDAAEAQVAAVQFERTRLQQIISSVPGVVWEAWGEPDSTRQRIDYVSDYVKEMLGYTPEEWTTTPNFWLQVVAPEDRETAARVAAETYRRRQAGRERVPVDQQGRAHHLGARALDGDQGRARAGRSACAG